MRKLTVWTGWAMALGVVIAAPNLGWSAEPALRTPLKSSETAHTTEVSLVRYHQATTVVRERTDGRRFAIFEAEPSLLSQGSALVFEIFSVAPTGVVPRWRCVALHDAADCLGTPVKMAYLPRDEKMVLKATLVPVSEVPEQTVALAKR